MMDILKRREDETAFEHKVRLCNAKLDKEIDLDWCEIVELLGMNCSSDHLRKLAYGYKEFNQYIKDKKLMDINEDDMLQEIEMKKLELQKERIKLQTTKMELNKNLRKYSRWELFYENLSSSKERLPLPRFNDIMIDESNSTEYILSISDIHYGANFVSENNNYSRKEVKKRFELLLYKVRQLIKRNNLKNIAVIELGDTIQGILRISDVKINDIPVVDSVIEISRLLATFLNELSKDVYVTYMHTSSANHSQNRYLGSKAGEFADEDMEKIIAHYIHDLLLNNDRVDVILSESDYHSFEINGQNILTMHGHQVKNINNAIKDYSILHKKFYDIVFLGHFHGGKTFSVGELNGNTEIIVCNSFIGSDPYSDSLKVGSKGMCKIYGIERNVGITETYTIVLN